MRRLLALFLFVTSLWAGKSVHLQNSTYLRAEGLGSSVPNRSLRAEGRISNWTLQQGSTQGVFSFSSNFSCRAWWNGVEWHMLCEFYPATAVFENPTVAIKFTGRNDIVFRVQRDVDAKRISLEVWNADGSGYASSTRGLANMPETMNLSSFFIGSAAGSLDTHWAFLKVFSTTEPLGGRPPHSKTSRGDLYNFDFEDDLVDVSDNNRNLTVGSGSVTYGDTASFPPHCDAGPLQTFRAGGRGNLDGSASFALDGNDATLTWRQVSGPTTVDFSGHNEEKPHVSNLVFGTYVFELFVTDSSGTTTSCMVKHGAVATDNKGVVVIPNRDHARFMTALTRYGVNRWSFYDDRHRAMSDWLVSVIDTRFAATWNNAASGTITVQNGSSKVYGDGTSFQTTFCGGPGNTAPVAGNRILIWYPSLIYSGETGRRPYPIVRCDSDTELTLGNGASDIWTYKSFDHAGDGSGLQYSLMNAAATEAWIFGPAPANYYDNVLALYAMYYRSGIDDYLITARKLADRWWEWYLIDKGHAYAATNTGYWIFAEPRSVALTGLILRALDDRPDMWVGIRRFLQHYATSLTAKAPVSDLRNQGYQMMWTSLGAIFDPDSEWRATHLNRVATSMKNKWIPYRQPDGSWLMRSGFLNSTGIGGTFYTGTAFVTNGSTTVTGNGTNFTRIDGNNTGCKPGAYIWFTTANSVYTSTGGVNGDPTAYKITTRPDDTNITLALPYQGADGSKNYACGEFVAVGVQPFMLSITASGLRWASEALKESSDPELQSLAQTAKEFVVGIGEWLITTGTHQESKGIYYGRTFPSCEATPMPSFCYNGGTVESLRISAGEALNGIILAYMMSGNENLKIAADRFASAMYAPPGDPDHDGTYLQNLNNGGYMFNPSNPLYIPKWYGWFFGISANWAWPAVRIGGLDPEELREVSISWPATDIPNARRVRLTVTRPDGNVTTFSCTSSPCTATVDARQLDHLVRIEYLSDSDEVLAVSDQQRLSVRKD